MTPMLQVSPLSPERVWAICESGTFMWEPRDSLLSHRSGTLGGPERADGPIERCDFYHSQEKCEFGRSYTSYVLPLNLVIDLPARWEYSYCQYHRINAGERITPMANIQPNRFVMQSSDGKTKVDYR